MDSDSEPEEGGNEGIDEEEESEFEEEDGESSSSAYSSEDESAHLLHRNILFLCEEGQLRIARRRFDSLVGDDDKIRREVFQTGPDGNAALHEILMGGTRDRNARTLVEQILDRSRRWPLPRHAMLTARPPSHGRTALHWAAWENSNLSILRSLVRGNPEALLLRDKKSKGGRTPSEIYEHYFIDESRADEVSDANREKFAFLRNAARRWTGQRLRNGIYAAAIYHFRKRGLTPFDPKDRKTAGVKPRPWFVLSVLGYLLQRETQPLLFHILVFVGKDAKVRYTATKKRKRKASQR